MKKQIPEFLSGTIVPMLTPMKENREIDLEGMQAIARWHIGKDAASALFPISGSGEHYALRFEEKKEIIEALSEEIDGQIPLMPGTHGESIDKTIELTEFAKNHGAQAVVIVVPKSVPPDDDLIFDYYKQIDDTVDISIMLYEPPGIGKHEIMPELIERLAGLENVAGIKDSSSNMKKLSRHAMVVKDQITIIQGVETLYLPALSIGAKGCIGGGCNSYPDAINDIRVAFNSRELEKALECQQKVIGLWDTIGTGWPASGKFVYKLFGLPVEETCRVSHSPITDEVRRNLESVFG